MSLYPARRHISTALIIAVSCSQWRDLSTLNIQVRE
jgi:hypothetical protein